jgi:hypothetical protein
VAVPDNVVEQLRDALHNVLSEAAQRVSEVADHANRDRQIECYEKPIERFRCTCKLLDVIGWDGRKHRAATQIDLQEHHGALLDGLEMARGLADDELGQIEAVDAGRAARREPPVRETTISRLLALHEFADVAEHAVAILLERSEGGPSE